MEKKDLVWKGKSSNNKKEGITFVDYPLESREYSCAPLRSSPSSVIPRTSSMGIHPYQCQLLLYISLVRRLGLSLCGHMRGVHMTWRRQISFSPYILRLLSCFAVCIQPHLSTRTRPFTVLIACYWAPSEHRNSNVVDLTNQPKNLHRSLCTMSTPPTFKN